METTAFDELTPPPIDVLDRAAHEALARLDPTPDALAHIGERWRHAAMAYLIEVGARTGSTRTPAEYRRYVARFLAGVQDPERITAAEVHTFVHAVGPSGRPPSASTISVRLGAIRGFLDFCGRMRLIGRNPARDVRMPRSTPPVPRGLSAPQVRRLLAAVPETPAGARDRALILTMILTGLRRTEVLSLRAGDIHHDPGSGRISYRVRAKGGVERHRELPPPALTAIRDSLAARGETLEELAAETRLFPIGSDGFYANLKRYAARAGLRGVTPHVLRHSAAKLRRETGASLEDVGALLGHRSLYTTARYLARLEGDHDDGWHGVAALVGVT